MLKIIKRVLDLSGSLSRRLWESFVCSFLEAVSGMLPLCAVFYFLSEAEGGLPLSSRAWLVILSILLGALVLRSLFQYLVFRLQSTAGFEFVARERIALGNRLRSVPMGFYHEKTMGEITATVTTDLNYLELYAMHVLDKVTTGVVSMIAVTLALLLFDWRIALIFAAGAACSFLVYRIMQEKGMELSKRQQEAQTEAISSTLEYIQGISVVKSFNMSQKNLGAIQNAYEKGAEAAYALEKTFAPLNTLYSSVFRAAACLIMLAGQLLLLNGELDFAELAIVLLAAFSIFTPIEVMGQMTQMMRILEASLDRVESIKQARVLDGDGRELSPASSEIEFRHVDFAYEAGTPVLTDVSFRIPEKTMTAIVGPSGSGKTTVSRLIARFWDVQKGSVTVGGYDVKKFTCDSLVKNISMVFQNVYLFSDTIENNIKFGNRNATHAQVEEAARKACCHEFIMALPEGYQTRVGEGGASLSGGERQRISIARAMLKDAPIVLLDEATASVDPENEAHLQQAISGLVKDKTLVVIAHRLPTIRKAHQILVLDGGEIVQRGTHEELLKEEGLYRSFWTVSQKARKWRIGS